MSILSVQSCGAQQFAAFEKSAAVYDLIHKNKSYDREAKIVAHHLRRSKDGHNKLALIDWGAGTGEFSRRFPQYRIKPVLCVEPCEEMAAIAMSKGLHVMVGRCEEKLETYPHDAACCLFSAFSYATAKHENLKKSLKNIRHYLRCGGRFVFDVVGAACAAHHLHTFRTHKFEDENGKLTRRMAKKFDAHTSLVTCEIDYELLTEHPERGPGECEHEQWREVHVMRAFTPPEIEFALKECGFRMLEVFDPEDDGTGDGRVSVSSFYFMVVAEAV